MKLVRSLLPIAAVAVVLSHVVAGEPRDDGDIQVPRGYDFEKMTVQEAKLLEGKRILVKAAFTGLALDYVREVVFQLRGLEPIRRVHFLKKDVPRSVPNGAVIVEGRMSLDKIVTSTETFTVLQLLDAEIVKP